MLVDKSGTHDIEYMADNYQEVIPETEEAQILYKINSADVRNSEIKSGLIKTYLDNLNDIDNDSRRTIKGTEILAYASPDGAIDKNNKLANDRSKSAKKAFDKIAKKVNTGEVSTRSLGEDWEGFQELVNASNMEDKDLILRVLSMYSDPNVREREIKNMSSVYTDLADNVLPELRRARFVTNVEYANYTPEELAELLDTKINNLDEEALLRAASLAKDNDTKLVAYDKAIANFNSERAKYNAAVTSLLKNDDKAASKYLASIKDKSVAAVKNLAGVLAMRAGNNDEAAKLFSEAGEVSNGNMAVLDILNGKYADAAAKLANENSYNGALASLLNNDLAKAEKQIASHGCPKCSYLKAIIAARKGDVEAAKTALATAVKNKFYADRLVNDIEFAKVK